MNHTLLRVPPIVYALARRVDQFAVVRIKGRRGGAVDQVLLRALLLQVCCQSVDADAAPSATLSSWPEGSPLICRPRTATSRRAVSDLRRARHRYPCFLTDQDGNDIAARTTRPGSCSRSRTCARSRRSGETPRAAAALLPTTDSRSRTFRQPKTVPAHERAIPSMAIRGRTSRQRPHPPPLTPQSSPGSPSRHYRRFEVRVRLEIPGGRAGGRYKCRYSDLGAVAVGRASWLAPALSAHGDGHKVGCTTGPCQ